MKRSRILLLCLLLGLLLLPVAWHFSGAGRDSGTSEHQARSKNSSAAEDASGTVAPGKGGRRETVDFAAKAASMLELRAGEVGIIPVPPDLMEDLPSEHAGPAGGPQFRGLLPKQVALRCLEKALRQGTAMQAKIGAGADGVNWKGGNLGITARLSGTNEGFPELLVESSADGETWKQSAQVPSGSCAVIRFASGESALVVIGGSFPVGGLTKEPER